MQITTLIAAVALALGVSSTSAAPLYYGGGGFGGSGGTSSSCGSYTIIVTRGTGEAQGPSIAFRNIVSNALRQAPGGVEYDTVYAASSSQISTAGTTDILNKIRTKLSQCPGHKFALLGYSQGAAATTAALNQITDTASFNAVRAAILLSNPRRTPNLKSNYDTYGGQSQRYARGLQAYQGGFNSQWVGSGKVLDVCAALDGVCDSATGLGISYAHLTAYPASTWTQNSGVKLIVDGVTRA